MRLNIRNTPQCNVTQVNCPTHRSIKVIFKLNQHKKKHNLHESRIYYRTGLIVLDCISFNWAYQNKFGHSVYFSIFFSISKDLFKT